LAGTPSAAPVPASPAPSAPPPNTVSGGTGISGSTVIDRGCAAQQVDAVCPLPFSTELTVLNEDTLASVATVRSDTSGHFQVTLPPGRYVLVPARPLGGLPRMRPVATIVVQADRYTVVTVRFDAGIR
jgi:hypothetical protein